MSYSKMLVFRYLYVLAYLDNWKTLVFRLLSYIFSRLFYTWFLRQPGFIKSSDDENSCTDIDECRVPSLNQCSNSKFLNCINTPGSYHCDCEPGFSPIKFDLKGHPLECTDINECKSSKHVNNSNSTKNNNSICPPKTRCKNTPGSYYCECDRGFQQIIDESSQNIQCIDVDECKLKLHNCGHHSRCVNYEGGFNCVCDKGYEKLNSGHCVDVDECERGQVCKAPGEICENTEPGYRCTVKYQKWWKLKKKIIFFCDFFWPFSCANPDSKECLVDIAQT